MCTRVNIVIHEDHTRARIENVAKAYKIQWPEEYSQATKQYEEWRNLNRDQYGSLEGDHTIKRMLVHLPETLDQALLSNLDMEEYQWFREKPQQIWFAKKFPEFKASADI